MTKRCLILSLAAGAACTTAAIGQVNDTIPQNAIKAEAPRTYGNRVNQVVYGTGLANGGDWRGMGDTLRRAADDVNFAPGPGAGGNIALNGAFFATVQSAAGTDNSQDYKLSIYDNYTGWTLGTFPGTNLIGSVTYVLANFNTPGFITFYDAPVAFPGGATITVPDANCLAVAEIFTTGTTTLHPTIYHVGRGTTASIVNPGSSNNDRWGDNNNDGLVDTGELFGAAAPNFRALYLGLQGDVPPPPLPTFTDLGALADTGSTQNGTLTAGTPVQWYRIVLNGDATDNAMQFLDIDTEGSTGDTAIAVYNATDGSLVGFQGQDEDSGSGVNAQLTYGIGRRAAVGDGRQYDGRDGEALAGEYLIAVAPGGSSFAAAYTVSVGAAAPDAFTLNLKTNTNGAPLAASVVPSGAEIVQDYGQILFPGIGGAPYTTPRQEAGWFPFEVCREASGDQWIDIDFSLSTGIADVIAHIFDSNGNLVATSDDEGTTNKPQFSFGNTGPRPALGAGLPDFAGQDGTLPVGQYYMAMGLFNVAPLANAATDGRWHVRANSGSSLDAQADVYTNIDSCGGGCAPCAADYDQSGGVDGDDIGAFFNDWQIGAPCGDVDSSGGVDGDDIGFFFERWQQGGCF